jgi:hypothetical protein
MLFHALVAKARLFPFRRFSNAMTCGKLLGMGNKDARRREVKKPKKKPAPKHLVTQIPSRVVSTPPAPKP